METPNHHAHSCFTDKESRAGRINDLIRSKLNNGQKQNFNPGCLYLASMLLNICHTHTAFLARGKKE